MKLLHQQEGFSLEFLLILCENHSKRVLCFWVTNSQFWDVREFCFTVFLRVLFTRHGFVVVCFSGVLASYQEVMQDAFYFLVWCYSFLTRSKVYSGALPQCSQHRFLFYGLLCSFQSLVVCFCWCRCCQGLLWVVQVLIMCLEVYLCIWLWPPAPSHALACARYYQ